MQTKKEDIKETILSCARDEFLKRGFDGSSLRMIAKKANTSLGNIYHYFPNKRAILDELLNPVIVQIDALVKEHVAYETEIVDFEEINTFLDQADYDTPQLKALFSKEFVIFIETKEEDIVKHREELMVMFRKHIAWHMKFDNPNNHFVVIVTNMIIDCIKHLSNCSECIHDKKKDTVDMFKILCRSVAGIDEATKK